MSESGDRIVAYFCPYCGGEDLRPHEAGHEPGHGAGHEPGHGAGQGAWECRECARVFSVTFVGLVVAR